MPLDFPANPSTGQQATLSSAIYEYDGTKWVSVGSLFARGTFTTGTAALPGFSVSGDTDTGFYAPAADQLAFTTSGSERLRIGPAGQIGIAGANYGTSGQVLTSGGASGSVTWTNGSDPAKIEEGNTKVEVIDVAPDGNGHVLFQTEGSEHIRIGPNGEIGIAGANYGTSGQVLTSKGLNNRVAWEDAGGGGATGGGSDKIFQENGQTVTTDYTIGTTFGSSNCNAMVAGPIVVNAGVTITVPSTANLIIL